MDEDADMPVTVAIVTPPIEVHHDGEALLVVVPFSWDFVGRARELGGVCRAIGTWQFPAASRVAVEQTLSAVYGWGGTT